MVYTVANSHAFKEGSSGISLAEICYIYADLARFVEKVTANLGILTGWMWWKLPRKRCVYIQCQITSPTALFLSDTYL